MPYSTEEVLSYLMKDDRKVAVIIDTNDLLDLKTNSTETFKYLVLAEKILSDHWSFIFDDRNNFIFEAFNRKVLQLIESGIARKIIEESTKFREASESHEPKVLTMHHVGVWFIIWICFLCGATAVFVVELLLSKFDIVDYLKAKF
jgi:hypothetical protein